MRRFDNLGTAPGEVFGVRWWSLTGCTRPVLHGAWGSWEPGENRAVCKHGAAFRPSHEAPGENCGCGYWAYWTPSATSPAGGQRQVIGVIKGYGDTLIGDEGFRCARARIVGLCIVTVARRAAGHQLPAYRLAGPGGVRCRQPEGALRAFEDDWAVQAELERVLSESYQVPVYTTVRSLLLHHPPTTDYLPRPVSADDLQRVILAMNPEATLDINWDALSRAMDEMGKTMAQATARMMAGADAMAQVMARLQLPPEA